MQESVQMRLQGVRRERDLVCSASCVCSQHVAIFATLVHFADAAFSADNAIIEDHNAIIGICFYWQPFAKLARPARLPATYGPVAASRDAHDET